MKKLGKSLVLLAALAAFFLLGYMFNETKSFIPLCSYSISDNVIPLVNENYFNMTYDTIENAESSIDIVLYEFKWYETNNSVVKLRELLVKKAEQGIKVRLILDQSQWMGAVTELSKENKRTGDYLKSYGIEVKYDSLKQTTHDKLLIIDDSMIILGSHNWGSSALTKNNEASVMIKDKNISE